MSDRILRIRTSLAVQDYHNTLSDLHYLLGEYDKLLQKSHIVSRYLYKLGETAATFPSPYNEQLNEIAKKALEEYNKV